MNNLFVKIRRKILGAGYIFDENRIKGSLTKLPIKLRILFAVTCAERLFPAYERFSAKTGGGNVDLLRRILDKLWMGLGGSRIFRPNYSR